jgi:hypothetical protein
MRVPEGPILPHQNFGDPECCGTLWPLIREDAPELANIICNECEVVVKTVPVDDLQRALREMEFSLDMCNPTCPHCGKENLITGFSEILAFTCRHCGKAVRLSNDL